MVLEQVSMPAAAAAEQDQSAGLRRDYTRDSPDGQKMRAAGEHANVVEDGS